MKNWLRGFAFTLKVKWTELRHGGMAARELAAAKFLKDRASRILDSRHAAEFPGFSRFMEDVRELSAKAGLPMPEVYVLQGVLGTPAMITRDKMIVPELSFFEHDSKQLRAIIGHELGHVKHGHMDTAPRNIARNRHHEEYAADGFSAEITGDPGSMIAVLESVAKNPKNMESHLSHPNPFDRIKRLEKPDGRSESFVDRLTLSSETQDRGPAR